MIWLDIKVPGARLKPCLTGKHFIFGNVKVHVDENVGNLYKSTASVIYVWKSLHGWFSPGIHAAR